MKSGSWRRSTARNEEETTGLTYRAAPYIYFEIIISARGFQWRLVCGYEYKAAGEREIYLLTKG